MSDSSTNTMEYVDELAMRERFRTIVLSLTEPTSLSSLTELVGWSYTRMEIELEWLARQGYVTVHENIDEEPYYALNRERLLLDYIWDEIQDNTKQELISDLDELEQELQEIEQDFGTTSIEELRLTAEDAIQPENARELRNAANTISTIQTEKTILKSAIRLYNKLTTIE